MGMKSVIAFVIFAVVVVILGYGLQMYQAGTVVEEPAPVQYSWNFTEAGVDENSQAPITRVTLIADGVSYDAGLYSGSCFEMERSPLALLPNEIAAVVCWFAGGGNEIGLFEEDGRTVAKVGIVDEGSAEVPPFRGDFTPLFEIGSDPRLARLELSLEEEGSALGVSVTPLSIEEDSRCPLDVQCIQAGTVRLRVLVRSGLGESTMPITLGSSITTEAESITLATVRPSPFSGARIDQQDYIFEFSVAKR